MPQSVTLLDIVGKQPGIVSVVGGGGKSSLLVQAGYELASQGKHVTLATSTHMYPARSVGLVAEANSIPADLDRDFELPYVLKLPPFSTPEHMIDALRQAHANPWAQYQSGSILCTGALDTHTKKLSAPRCGIQPLASLGGIVLVEADGSKHLPLKGHKHDEPVLCPSTRAVIYVIGASCFGKPVRSVAHRPELFCQRASCTLEDLATPEVVARALCAEHILEYEHARSVVVVNQAESSAAQKAAQHLAKHVCAPVYAGSVLSNTFILCQP